jgi:hypothetical protein
MAYPWNINLKHRINNGFKEFKSPIVKGTPFKSVSNQLDVTKSSSSFSAVSSPNLAYQSPEMEKF